MVVAANKATSGKGCQDTALQLLRLSHCGEGNADKQIEYFSLKISFEKELQKTNFF